MNITIVNEDLKTIKFNFFKYDRTSVIQQNNTRGNYHLQEMWNLFIDKKFYNSIQEISKDEVVVYIDFEKGLTCKRIINPTIKILEDGWIYISNIISKDI